jgi:hypothetical protein
MAEGHIGSNTAQICRKSIPDRSPENTWPRHSVLVFSVRKVKTQGKRQGVNLVKKAPLESMAMMQGSSSHHLEGVR